MRRPSSERYILQEISSGLPEPEPVAVAVAERGAILLTPEPVVLDGSTMLPPAILIGSGRPDITLVATIPDEAEVALNLPRIVCEL